MYLIRKGKDERRRFYRLASCCNLSKVLLLAGKRLIFNRSKGFLEKNLLGNQIQNTYLEVGRVKSEGGKIANIKLA